MANCNHPINGRYDYSTTIPDDFERPYFARFIGRNRNAIPARTDDGALSFNIPEGEFFACSHELEIELAHDLVEIDKVLECFVACEYTRFDKFVEKINLEKMEAKRIGDVLNYVFAKLLMNSGYGRAGINPANFEDWIFTETSAMKR